MFVCLRVCVDSVQGQLSKFGVYACSDDGMRNFRPSRIGAPLSVDTLKNI